MSSWQPVWNRHIIETINPQLEKEFDNDSQKIISFLEEKNLLDLGVDGKIGDRTYSALSFENQKYQNFAYIDVFPKEVNNVVLALKNFKEKLSLQEDEIYDQKELYLNYLEALINAFNESDTSKTIKKWMKVDESWMKITSPFQIGHPLEYYEDHYRKAVALEWDLRFSNPNSLENKRADKIKNMHEKISKELGKETYKSAYEYSSFNLNKVQLYLGRPILYSGAQFNGLFSAQVVPNDTIVSEKEGKKIFAFADMVLQNSRNKPFMRLPSLIFEKKFLQEFRTYLFQETEKWHQIYDIETIGHEYGHVLWLDEETEIVMNKTGNFKNIEEFKATTGGLVSYFLDEEGINFEVLREHLLRSVNLIAWMEVGEVQPYYCEGLIHLKGLFDSKILSFDGTKLNVNLTQETYDNCKRWYLKTYKKLAKHYLDKKDATDFLSEFAIKEDSIFLPVDNNIKEFVNFYYDLFKKHGNEIDEEDKKENYL